VGLAYLLILFVIPHTVFPEGVALAALLLAQTVEPRKWRAAYGAIASGVLCIAVPLTYRHTAVYGFYPWEQTADGYTRWTATKSRGVFSCATTVELRLRNETPQTQRVEVSTITGTNHATLKNGEALFVALSCHDFTPFKYGIGNDNRLLGIRQESPKPIL
jgi:cobalamin biosynthesis protein CobD/CbiB